MLVSFNITPLVPGEDESFEVRFFDSLRHENTSKTTLPLQLLYGFHSMGNLSRCTQRQCGVLEVFCF